jgi:methionyl-tRNA formyltransferase
MFWRLPPPLRALLVSNYRLHAHRIHQCRYSSSKHADPLRILFCGSDEFSIKSLNALKEAQRETPGLIEEIHVAHRPAKPTGRGLKVLREGNNSISNDWYTNYVVETK